MRKGFLAVLMLMPLLAARPARALDQQAFNAVASEIPVPTPDKYDERAVLAGLLARPNEAAEFDADAKAALADPQLKPLLVAKWRGKAAAFAAVDVNRGGADPSKTYHNWKEVLGPEGYAYTRQRLLSMSKDNADKLIGYLGLLDQKLQENNYKLDFGFFAMSGKIVNGILDAYRKDLNFYLAVPGTQASRNGAAGASQQLASAIQAKNAVAAAPSVPPALPSAPATAPATRPVVPAHPKTPPAKPKDEEKLPPPAPKAPVPPSNPPAPNVPPQDATAREQLERARRAGEAAGGVFDGGLNAGVPPAPVAPGANLGGPKTPPGGLAPSAPGAAGPVVGAVPSPLDDLDARVAHAAQSGTKPYAGKLGLIAAGGGGLLGGLIGFLLGGPIGALIGAAVGAGAGYLLSKRF